MPEETISPAEATLNLILDMYSQITILQAQNTNQAQRIEQLELDLESKINWIEAQAKTQAEARAEGQEVPEHRPIDDYPPDA